ncbi:aconitate hydratase AcnA [Streptomyces sp. NPDC006355]|uniref:aconitate hydratase AcnA n=1 Tax=Streptomyces sp. NPDC006355 TaxID=3156758 RepID=UPI0033AEF18F
MTALPARHDLHLIAESAGVDLAVLPYTARVLLENAAHLAATGRAEPGLVRAVARWGVGDGTPGELSFLPSRVVLQDYSGIPVILDLAALRAAAVRQGLPAGRVSPVIPAHLVVDHTVRADVTGRQDALHINTGLEFAHNEERYALLRWAEQAFPGLRVVPPGKGIVHQINLERLARVVAVGPGADGQPLARPDTVLGTDSHTSMAGALGVLGWGVGGIEAVSALLGEPVLIAPPRVVGVRLTGCPRPGTTATDLVLTLNQLLREYGVVGAILEFHGEGTQRLSVPDRATIANMAPDHGATTSFFPVDDETLRFLRATGRDGEHVTLVESYCRAQGLFREAGTESSVRYAEDLSFDLGDVEPCVAGPHRPDQRLPLSAVPRSLTDAGSGTASRPAAVGTPQDGAVLIAALTSCTNTSHPASMITAGLVARRAVELGLTVPPWTKTSLAPGSRTVPAYLDEAGLLAPLEKLGFGVVAFGCTTCHGNSGPLTEEGARAVTDSGVVGTAVLSGNRNFEGRIHPQIRAAYLASPGLVVAYALAGTVVRDLTREPVAVAPDGRPVHLRDLWPDPAEVAEAVRAATGPGLFADVYDDLFEGDERWRSLDVRGDDLYAWPPDSQYILRPPYIDTAGARGCVPDEVTGARILVLLGDRVTTDHISPVGPITPDSEAGTYLTGAGVPPDRLGSFGTRRGNHHVMVRGTFANPRLRNAMAEDGRPGPWTRHHPSGEPATIHSAAERYRSAGVPVIVVAGREYGAGSARDWAAKGTALLGVRAVLAESFERIHRGNLVGMGVLPLCFPAGESSGTHRLDGTERINLVGLSGLRPRGTVRVRVRRADDSVTEFEATAAVETAREAEYLRVGGILPYVTSRFAEETAR